MTLFESKYFALSELISSQTASRKGIDNTPTEKAIKNLEWLVKKILDPLRAKLGKPIVISSGYRSPKLNKDIGSSEGSQHVTGKAADIIVPGMTANEVFNFICNKTSLPFDQMIEEFATISSGWVHISYDRDKRRQRGIKMVATKSHGKITYTRVLI